MPPPTSSLHRDSLMDCYIQYGGCSLLVRWVYSLFLVTAVKKLPSSGALWHAA